MSPIPVLILFGPTASGKTEILKRLFDAQFFSAGAPFKAEIVSADSMQVYRGMDIGTAKPSPAERARISHHLIDIRNPDEQFHAGDFVRLADLCCAEIAGRGALPVISGGTGFYLKNFILGLPAAPPSDAGIRDALKEELQSRGASALMEELARCDPVSAHRIHINDEYRILRALEVFRLSGKPLSSYSVSGGAGGAPEGESVEGLAAEGGPSRKGRYRFLIIGLEWERGELYSRINLRSAEMFRAGLPTEVQRLREQGYSPDDPGLKAIGYREFFIEDTPGHYRFAEDPAGMETLVAQNSRHYAKRQITFFASIPEVKWVVMGDHGGDNPVSRIRRELEEFLK
ncbi:tRNA dimethylallyltransferase 1 [Spirochaetia bacterium]|nr:tRNA dimethylallyltransferase 1 [Spirochaetia bacterium]